jgi:hypothetical protein
VDLMLSIRLGDRYASLLLRILIITLVSCWGHYVLVAIAKGVACQDRLVGHVTTGALLALVGFTIVHLIVLLLGGGAWLLKSHSAISSRNTL